MATATAFAPCPCLVSSSEILRYFCPEKHCAREHAAGLAISGLDEAINLGSLFCIADQCFDRADERLAAIAGAYTNTDLAGGCPDVQPVPGPEYSTNVLSPSGASWIAVCNVSRPTMTVYSPKGKNTGVAVVVFPGGGYNCLAMDLEGTEICDWLTSKGITAVLLKYRVPTPIRQPYGASPMALEDAQRTLGLVRFHAAEWQIDPHKIGVHRLFGGRDIWWRRRARILTSVRIRRWMRRTKKVAARILRSLVIRAICGATMTDRFS